MRQAHRRAAVRIAGAVGAGAGVPGRHAGLPLPRSGGARSAVGQFEPRRASESSRVGGGHSTGHDGVLPGKRSRAIQASLLICLPNTHWWIWLLPERWVSPGSKTWLAIDETEPSASGSPKDALRPSPSRPPPERAAHSWPLRAMATPRLVVRWRRVVELLQVAGGKRPGIIVIESRRVLQRCALYRMFASR